MSLINKILLINPALVSLARRAGEGVNIQVPGTSPSKLASSADSSAEVTSIVNSFMSIILNFFNVNKINYLM